MRACPLLLLLSFTAACKVEVNGFDCGEGTHAEGDACVVDTGDSGAGDTASDTDSAVDTSDTDTGDTDTATDTGADTADTDTADTDTATDSGTDTATDTGTDTGADTSTDSGGDTSGADPDDDGDGYPASTDCDDTDPAVNPGATEVCDDGVDDDCDGVAAGCWWSEESDLASPSIELRGHRASEGAGYDVAVGDVNGDGQPDVVVGAPYADDGIGDGGSVYVMYGPITADKSLSGADAILAGNDANGETGLSVAVVDDTDGDGTDEVVIGQRYPSNTSPGAVYLFTGAPTGTLDVGLADGLWTGEGNGNQLGVEVASVGDVDGDGNGDFAAGASENGTRSTNGGSAYVFFGGALGTGLATDADSRIYGSTPVQAGTTIAGAGDTDGDGFDDLIVGTDGNTGQVALFLGPPAATTYFSSGDASIKSEHSGDYLGGDRNELSAAGDVDGDGLGDVWLGAYGNDDGGSNAGKAYLLLGPITGALDLFVDSDATVTGTTASGVLGQGLSSVGDVDADGHTDAVVGAQGASRYGGSTGAAYFFYGPVSGSLDDTDADASFVGANAGVTAGISTAAADITGDGVLDLVVGAPYDDGDSTGSGSVWVVPGVGF